MRILLIPNATRADALAFADAMIARLGALGHEAYLYHQPDDPRLAETDLALGAICHRVVEISYGTEEIWK